MPNTDLSTRLIAARRLIEDLFKNQCKHGLQNPPEFNGEAASCGQFLELESSRLAQRGMHGTAGAIFVLSDTSERELLSKLLNYVSRRQEFESNLDPKNRASDERIESDDRNVIKISELIIALKRLPVELNANELIMKLSQRLKESQVEERGWDYFTSGKSVEILPTTYAYLALFRTGEVVYAQSAKEYLKKHLRDRYIGDKKPAPARSDIITDLQCSYVLAFNSAESDRKSTDQISSKVFQCAWNMLSSSLNDDFEQTVEYMDTSSSYYVRIPWQLYMVALASRHDYFLKFYRPIISRYLDRILKSVQGKGFYYPHSTPQLSSRTYAILYEVFGQINDRISEKGYHALWERLFRVRQVVSQILWSKWTKSIVMCVALFMVIQSILYTPQEVLFSSIGVNLFSSIFVTIIYAAGRE